MNEARKKELENENNQLNEEFKKLKEQGAVINRRVSEIQARQLQLQGAYQELLNIEKGESAKPETVKTEKPVKA